MPNVAIVTPCMVDRDAVCNDVAGMYRALVNRGYRPKIFAGTCHTAAVPVEPIERVADFLRDESDILIYHFSMGWDVGLNLLNTLSCHKVVRSHNVTPPHFFEQINQDFVNTCTAGREELKSIAAVKDAYYLSASEFNAEELHALGIDPDRSWVLPPFHLIDQLQDIQADATVVDRYLDGKLNVLMVGRVAPNKGHGHLIEAFAAYFSDYNPDSRLIIVGKIDDRLDSYNRTLRDKIKRHGLEQHVVFTEGVSQEELKAYYLVANVFMITSEHEGFCVPLVEAMSMKIPVVAHGSTAIPYTVDKAGLVWDQRDPDLLAASLNYLANHEDIRQELGELGWRRYHEMYDNQRIEADFLNFIDRFTSSSKKPKIAIVPPWFGENIPGGAENLVKTTIPFLQQEFEVEVLTTCVKDFHSSWNEDFWKPGEYHELGVTVRRFPVRVRDETKFDMVNRKLMSGEPITQIEESQFFAEMVRSEELNKFLATHKEDYSSFIYIPYMFGTTVDGVKITREKSVLIPCLHDESYAYLQTIRDTVKQARVLLHNTYTEQRLADKIFGQNPKHVTVGAGVETNLHFHSGEFKAKHGLKDFILYAGRKDTTKNVHVLVEYFDRYVRETGRDLELVMIGASSVDLLGNPRIHDLGFVSAQDKYNAMADAICLAQPSLNESFSYVMMESWLCGRPCLVHAGCGVTNDHCELSGGGLAFMDYDSFKQSISWFLAHPEESAEMAELGKQYVLQNFSWAKVMRKYISNLAC